MARVNGVLGGVAASESFALSQCFYFGHVQGNGPIKVELIDGDFVDQLDYLDVGAVASHNIRAGASGEAWARIKRQVDWAVVYSADWPE